MSDKQSNLTDKEMEDLQNIVADTLASICVMADRHNIDRDSMLKYFADMLTVFTEVASIQNYKTSHTCNCQHNSNSRENEPCCRCDSKHTNKPIFSHNLSDTLSVFHCECGNTIKVSHDVGIMDNNNAPNYCSKCGCRLDWGDENETDRCR